MIYYKFVLYLIDVRFKIKLLTLLQGRMMCNIVKRPNKRKDMKSDKRTMDSWLIRSREEKSNLLVLCWIWHTWWCFPQAWLHSFLGLFLVDFTCGSWIRRWEQQLPTQKSVSWKSLLMVVTERREQKHVNKHQGQHCSQKSTPDVLHQKLRVVSARTSVRCSNKSIL